MPILSHVSLGASDMARSASFYDSTLATLGIKQLGSLGEKGVLYGVTHPEFLLLQPINGQPCSSGNGSTIGFAASSQEAVRQFHAAGLANGGSDEGAPGPRPIAGPTAYGAYLRDPDGNKICAYCFADN